MTTLFGIQLVPAAVPRTATFLQAAETLAAYPVSTIAVLDDTHRVIGLFSSDDLLEGLFPAYLRELHHTAFATDDPDTLERRAKDAANQPVTAYMDDPITLELTTSATHAAERFLHSRYDALPVTTNQNFIGMLDRSAFCRAILASHHHTNG